LPDPDITALRSASIFTYPDPTSEELGIIDPDERVTVRGLPRSPWENWLYVYQARADVTGYVWAPYFEWPKLELYDIEPTSFCSEREEKRAGLRIWMGGGDGRYVFYWGQEIIYAVERERQGTYLVHWPWGTWSSTDTLTVASGDGQRSQWRYALFVGEPSCSP
jgi:hypothetical protein